MGKSFRTTGSSRP